MTTTAMTPGEIQEKYNGIHTADEVETFEKNMANSTKWKMIKGEWTWDGLNHMRLRGRALEYHPSLDGALT